jgi:hypothetical protein
MRAHDRILTRNKLSDKEVDTEYGEAADLAVAPGGEDDADVLCAVAAAAAFEPSIVEKLGSDA